MLPVDEKTIGTRIVSWARDPFGLPGWRGSPAKRRVVDILETFWLSDPQVTGRGPVLMECHGIQNVDLDPSRGPETGPDR